MLTSTITQLDKLGDTASRAMADFLRLVESVSSAMRVFGICCSHNSRVASGATTSDCWHRIRESKYA